MTIAIPAPTCALRPSRPLTNRAVAAPKTNRKLGIVAIVISATGMGTAGMFGRMATPVGALMGEALTLGRMLVGLLGMLVILAASGRLGMLRTSRLSWPIVLGGVFLGLSLATYLSATVLIDLSLAVVLHYLGPVIATLLARVMLKEPIANADALSLAASFGGMLLAAGLVGGNAAPTSDQQTLGIVLGVVSGIFYGGALLCYRYRSDVPADVRSFWNFAFGALATGGMVALTRPDLSGMTPAHWAWATGLFVVCGLLALGMLVVAGKHLRAAELSGLSYWEIVVAMMMGAAVFGERISLLAMVGVGLIVVAAVLPLLSGSSQVRAGQRTSRTTTVRRSSSMLYLTQYLPRRARHNAPKGARGGAPTWRGFGVSGPLMNSHPANAAAGGRVPVSARRAPGARTTA